MLLGEGLPPLGRGQTDQAAGGVLQGQAEAPPPLQPPEGLQEVALVAGVAEAPADPVLHDPPRLGVVVEDGRPGQVRPGGLADHGRTAAAEVVPVEVPGLRREVAHPVPDEVAEPAALVEQAGMGVGRAQVEGEPSGPGEVLHQSSEEGRGDPLPPVLLRRPDELDEPDLPAVGGGPATHVAGPLALDLSDVPGRAQPRPQLPRHHVGGDVPPPAEILPSAGKGGFAHPDVEPLPGPEPNGPALGRAHQLPPRAPVLGTGPPAGPPVRLDRARQMEATTAQ